MISELWNIHSLKISNLYVAPVHFLCDRGQAKSWLWCSTRGFPVVRDWAVIWACIYPASTRFRNSRSTLLFLSMRRQIRAVRRVRGAHIAKSALKKRNASLFYRMARSEVNVHWGVISAKAIRIHGSHLLGFMANAEWLGCQCEQIPGNNEHRVIAAACEVSHRSVVSPQLRYRTWHDPWTFFTVTDIPYQ